MSEGYSIPDSENKKEKKNIIVACWVIWGLTLFFTAIPIIPTFWIWIPLWIIGIVLAIIVIARGEAMTGIIGLLWSIIGIWPWWIITGLISARVIRRGSAAVCRIVVGGSLNNNTVLNSYISK